MPDLDAVEQQIVQQTNAFRKEKNRDALATAEKLSQTAQKFADYMARTNRYGHEADGRSPGARASAHEYTYCVVAENIAYQFSTQGIPTDELATKFVTGWKNSPGHRRNMLDPAVTETGLGVAQSEQTGVYYAVQMFGRPKSAQIEFQIANQSEQAVDYVIGKQTFSLSPRYIRTHRVCRPSELIFQLPEKGDSMTKQTVEPRGGEEYVLKSADAGVTVQKKAE